MFKNFKKYSVKKKIIVFFILSIIGLTSVFFSSIKDMKNKKEKNEDSNVKSYIVQSDDDKKISNDKEDAKLNENKHKIKEQENKKIEQLFKKGYDAFFDKKYEEAIKIEDEVINLDSSFFKAYNVKGIALCFNGKYEEGMKNIDKSLEINANYGYGRFNKALALELYGHYDEALKWYDKNLEVEDYIWSYYGKASIYGRRGEVANAVKYLKKAVDMDSSVKETAKNEEDFEPIRNSKEFQDIVKN